MKTNKNIEEKWKQMLADKSEQFAKDFFSRNPKYRTEDMLQRDLLVELSQLSDQAIAERDREIVMAVKGVRDALAVSLHNAVNDQRAPYRHAIQAIDEEIVALLT